MGKVTTLSSLTCNVLQTVSEGRRLWQFGVSNNEVTLAAETALLPSEPLPARIVTKDWRSLWRRKLNLAWLPAHQVFLRVVHLPAANLAELRPMVELQLEKLSPLPVTQIAWSIEVLPPLAHPGLADNRAAGSSSPPADTAAKAESKLAAAEIQTVSLQTVILLIIARNQVESFLGQLEGQGYLADRLEFPLLHQLVTTPVHEDGVWVYPSADAEKRIGLVAWWSNRSLQNLALLHLPANDQWQDLLGEQLTRMAWAGELDGWRTASPRWHLVADETAAALWQPALDRWIDEPVAVISALPPAKLAALNVQRVAQQTAQANLLPAEHAARYQQLFIDRLWMRGLAALAILYTLGVAVFLGWLQYVQFQKSQVEANVARLAKDYQKARQLKEQIRVLQEQVSLKFAALDCWKAVAETLPPELTLSSMSFTGGKRLSLFIQAPTDQITKVSEFNMALAKSRMRGADGPLLFRKIDPPTPSAVQGAASVQTWSFNCELNSPEIQ